LTSRASACTFRGGELSEWPKEPDSKSGVPVRVPWVRIPRSPPRKPAQVCEGQLERQAGDSDARAVGDPLLQVVFIFSTVSPMVSRATFGACLLLPALAAGATGCDSSAAADSDAGCVEFNPPSGPPAPAFDNFCNWHSAPATNSEDASDGVHAPPDGGPRGLTVFWNNSPPDGSKSFPIGTIIIKESQDSNPTDRVAFAMTNRGCGYNADGAQNWEFWSLADNGNCTMTTLWRGPIAPMAETYAGKPAGDCNGCHGMVVDNDYVWDTALQLSNF
jgi:hypothetical protein